MAERHALLAALAIASCALACGTGSAGPKDAGPEGAEVPCPTPSDAGPSPLPSLARMDVEATGRSVLVPAFSPSIHDYYVKCSAGTNALAVSVAAPGGAKAKLSIETPASPKSLFRATGSVARTLAESVSLEENDAIVATVTDGRGSEEYWVRCLPHDFSPMKWIPRAGCARRPGYYLVGNVAPATGSTAHSMVLDTNGVPVWYAPVPPAGGVYAVDDVGGGSASYVRWPPKVGLELYGLAPPGKTTLPTEGWQANPHEVRRLPNGHYLVFTDLLQSGVDLTGYDVALPDGGVERFGPHSNILNCDILEVDGAGKIVWKWVSTDHLDPVKDNAVPGLLGTRVGLEPDPFHCNSIDVDPTNGNLLVSARQLDSVFYIDRATGKILWKLGGSPFTKDHALDVPMAAFQGFQLQHDARFRPGWSPTCGGRISLFDDEWAGNRARGIVYDVTLSGRKPDGESCGTVGAKIAWQFSGKAFSVSMGSFRIQDDGSSLIGWGYGSEPGPAFSEIDVNSHDVLDLFFTDGTPSYRAVKVPLDALDLADLRSSAGLNLE